MNKKKDLASALAAQDEAGQGSQPLKSDALPNTTKPVPSQPGRSGQVAIAAWFPLKVKLELEELRLERSRKLGRKITLQQMQAEAYNDLFKKYGRPEMAPIT